jgi:uncharacterized protein (DUF1015 family)
MLTVKPFRAVRPASDLAEKVSSLPYDVRTPKKRVRWRKAMTCHFCMSSFEIDLSPKPIPFRRGLPKAAENWIDFWQTKLL